MKKVFFDVETNNIKNDRICQIGVIYEEDGKEVFAKSWYVDPETPFSKRTIAIHGITPEMVQGAPLFPEVWEEIRPYFLSSVVIGHNVKSDLTVLDKTLVGYGIREEALTAADTMDKASRVVDVESYGLDVLCEYFHISLDQHHDALCDAKACRALYHKLDEIRPWTEKDEFTQWMGKAKMKLDRNSLDRALMELDGIVFGILSDSHVSFAELTPIENWSDEHAAMKRFPGYQEAYAAVERILDNGKVNAEDAYEIHQLAVRYRYNTWRRGAESLYILKGIVSGILADEKLSEKEIHMLKDWMLRSGDLKDICTFARVYEELERILADGKVTKAEAKGLIEVLNRFLSLHDEEHPDQNLSVKDKVVTLAGTFVFGSHRQVAERIRELGGTVETSVKNNTDIVIVGGEGNTAWRYGDYGYHVRKALMMQDDGHPVMIVGESEVL